MTSLAQHEQEQDDYFIRLESMEPEIIQRQSEILDKWTLDAEIMEEFVADTVCDFTQEIIENQDGIILTILSQAKAKMIKHYEDDANEKAEAEIMGEDI